MPAPSTSVVSADVSTAESSEMVVVVLTWVGSVGWLSFCRFFA